jgi:Rrf2 family protein
MRISAKVDYAVRAATELAASEGDDPIKGDDIARNQEIPMKFLENILSELRHAGIVASQRGSAGGYWLAKAPGKVSIADIIRAVEGPLATVRGERPDELDYHGPSKHLRDVWVATRANVRAVLEKVTLEDVVDGKLPAVVSRIVAKPSSWGPH